MGVPTGFPLPTQATATVHGVTELDMTKQFNTHTQTHTHPGYAHWPATQEGEQGSCD